MNDLTFKLNNKLKFADLESGADDQTFEIYLRAPAWNDRKQMFKLKAHVERSFMKMATELSDLADDAKDQTTDDDRMDGGLVMTMLASGCGDLERAFDDFIALAVKVGSFNDKTPLQTAHFERMGLEEAMRMMGEYIGFFIVPSVLSMTKGSGSES